jgi:hypothetical protein
MSWTDQGRIKDSTHPKDTCSNSGRSEPGRSASTHWSAQFYHNALNFVLGGVGGAFGAAIVYPVDLGMLLLNQSRLVVTHGQ